jgi:predicted MFS family arabinose efflux permease
VKVGRRPLTVAAPSELAASAPEQVQDWLVVFIAISAMTLPSVLPVMIGALAGDLGLGVAKAGLIASANSGGLMVGSLACSALAKRATPRRLLVCGLAVMIAGHLLATLSGSFVWLWSVRAVSGFGDGIAAGTCYALMARSRHPGRAIAYYAAGQGLIGAVGLALTPGLVAHSGWRSLFIAVSLVAVPALLCATRIRTRSLSRQAGKLASAEQLLRTLPAAAGIVLFFCGLGAIWGFMERIGVAHRFPPGQVAAALSASALATLVGSTTVGVWAHRLSVAWATAIGFVLLLAGFACLFQSNYAAFVAALVLLNFLWGFQYPFLFQPLAAADVSGRLTTLTPALTGSGLAVGVALGGAILQLSSLTVLSVTAGLITTAGLVLGPATSFLTQIPGAPGKAKAVKVS